MQGSLVVTKRGQVSSNFLASHQWKLFKKAFETNNIELIFVGPAIKRAMCEEARKMNDYKNGDNDSLGAEVLKKLVIAKGHNDHFHIRVKCTDRRCSRISYNYKNVGC
jgi:penicillin-insensitive murein endopeptidase